MCTSAKTGVGVNDAVLALVKQMLIDLVRKQGAFNSIITPDDRNEGRFFLSRETSEVRYTRQQNRRCKC